LPDSCTYYYPPVMNLVTAVVVEGAIEQGKDDRESRARYKQYAFKKMLPNLKSMFHKLDKDGDGTITLIELQHAPEAVKQQLERYLHKDSDSIASLFEIIDVDDSGEVDIDEFCDGVAKLVHCDSPIELVRILKQLNVLRKDVEELKNGSLTRHLLMETNWPSTSAPPPLSNVSAKVTGIRNAASATDVSLPASLTTTSTLTSEDPMTLTNKLATPASLLPNSSAEIPGIRHIACTADMSLPTWPMTTCNQASVKQVMLTQAEKCKRYHL